MRIVKVGVLAPTNKGIPLGVQGENSATQVEFDTRPWFREYPSGTVSAVARRYGDPAPYPLNLDVADGTAVWQVSDTDTAKAGEGAVELTMTSGGARVRSLTFKTLVTASLTDSPVDDDAWYGWLDKAVVKVDETVQSAQRKMDEVDLEWTALKADVTEKVDECVGVAAQAASDAHHAKVDAQATAKALESAEGSVAKAEAAANRAVDAAIAADDSAVEASRSALSAVESAEAAAGSATTAATSASEAATSASNAATSASSAAVSAEHATAQKVAAENAKGAAESFKAGAEAAKGEAARSATNAASSATAAAKSAIDAAASVNAVNVIAPKTVGVAASSEVDGSVAVGEGSVAKNANELSIGNDTLTREITHVSTPTAPTSASTKKYTDDNDAKTLSEAKQYTDANTSNALVGTVSGKLLHVEDAWPCKPLGLTIDGAYKQDGTPSPENPVPITVVENPVLKVTGKNQFDGDISKVSGNSVNLIYLSKGTYTISLISNVDWWSNASNNKTVYIHSADNVYLTSATFINPAVGKRSEATFTLNEDAQIKVYSYGAWKNDAVSDVQIEKCTVATDYAPYTSQSLPITLPAEHPYLAKLPDGTADTIEVDKDGNASLVARVSKATIVASKIVDTWGKGYAIYGWPKDGRYSPNAPYDGTAVVCDKLKAESGSNIYHGTGIGVSVGSTIAHVQSCVTVIALGDGADVSSIDGAVLYYPLMTPVTYPIDKVTVPSLPESISNVWTDAELTPECAMTYKRDVNVVIAGLTAQIAALKGTNDILHDDSTASPDDAIDVLDNDVNAV